MSRRTRQPSSLTFLRLTRSHWERALGFDGIADRFNDHVDEFRIAHVQRTDGWIANTWNNISDPVRSPRQGPKRRKAASRHHRQTLARSAFGRRVRARI